MDETSVRIYGRRGVGSGGGAKNQLSLTLLIRFDINQRTFTIKTVDTVTQWL